MMTYETIASSWHGLTFGFGAGLLYGAYYFMVVAQRPILSGNRQLVHFVRNFCPILTAKFYPTFWCFEARAQTILGSIFKGASNITYTREVLSLADGGCLGLDWCYNDAHSAYTRDDRPTILILPGVAGCSEANYARNFIGILRKQGYRTLVLNYRGNGGVPLKTPRTYCASKVDDLTEVIEHVHNRFPKAPLLAAGISMGGMQLMNYLAKHGTSTPVRAAMVVSTPFNAFESAKQLEQPLNILLFNKHITNLLISKIKNYTEWFNKKNDINIPAVMKSSTVREFDTEFTAKLFGYDSWQEYYADASSHDKLHHVKVPVLAVNAADDPFFPHTAIPVKAANSSSSIVIAVVPYGGHIGFLDGWFPRYETYIDRVLRDYTNAVLTVGDQIVSNEET